MSTQVYITASTIRIGKEVHHWTLQSRGEALFWLVDQLAEKMGQSIKIYVRPGERWWDLVCKKVLRHLVQAKTGQWPEIYIYRDGRYDEQYY